MLFEAKEGDILVEATNPRPRRRQRRAAARGAAVVRSSKVRRLVGSVRGGRGDVLSEISNTCPTSFPRCSPARRARRGATAGDTSRRSSFTDKGVLSWKDGLPPARNLDKTWKGRKPSSLTTRMKRWAFEGAAASAHLRIQQTKPARQNKLPPKVTKEANIHRRKRNAPV